MAITVFFREEEEIFKPETYIPAQPAGHRQTLSLLVQHLEEHGNLHAYHYSPSNNGDWFVLLPDQKGEMYQYRLFISRFENSLLGNIGTGKKPEQKEKDFVIINPAGTDNTIQEYPPAYWSAEHYASFFEPAAAAIFMDTVSKIKLAVSSPDYSVLPDGTVSIHIKRSGGAYDTVINCRGKWMDRK